jgi:hypothetical protein
MVGSGLALMLAAAATQAPAKPADWQDAPATVSRRILQDFAWCTVRREPALARSFALMNEGERLAPADFEKLFDGRCLGMINAQLQMRACQSRAALAEALLVRDASLRRATSFASAGALNWSSGPAMTPANPEIAARFAAANADDQPVGKLGECVVRADPAGAMDVLKTKIDSDAERKRFAALAPRIVACVQQGQTRSFNRTNLRAGMALAYFRLASAVTAQGKV